MGMNTDCFAYRNNKLCRCDALIENICMHDECPFYKPKTLYKKDIEQAKKRIEGKWRR